MVKFDCFPFLVNRFPNVSEAYKILGGGERDKRQSKHELAFGFMEGMMLLISFFIVSSNCALIIGVRKTSKHVTLSQKLYVWLALTDAVFGSITTPYFIIITKTGHRTCISEGIGTAFSTYSFTMGMGTLFMISILRNFAIRKPLLKISQRTVVYSLLIWNGYMVGKGVMTFFVHHPTFTNKLLTNIYWWAVSITTSIEVTTIFVLNSFSQKSLSRRDSFSELGKGRRRHQSAVKTLALISILYVVCYLPIIIFYAFLAIILSDYNSDPQSFYMARTLYPLFHTPMVLCSGLNAIVYMSRSNEIKNYYKRLFFSCPNKYRSTGNVELQSIQYLNSQNGFSSPFTSPMNERKL